MGAACNHRCNNSTQIENQEIYIFQERKKQDLQTPHVTEIYEEESGAAGVETQSELNHQSQKHYQSIYVQPEITETVQNVLDMVGPFQFKHRNQKQIEGIDDHNQISRDEDSDVILEIEDQSMFKGQLNQNGDFQRGQLYQVDQSLFEGYFSNKLPHKCGRMIFYNGDYYQGEWVEGKFNGTGKYRSYDDGTVYSGFWINNLQEGKGEETWTDGTKYDGDFSKGKQNGQGRLSWTNGSYYEGEFRENNINGQGFYRSEDGNTYEGDWLDSKMDGKGIYKYTDGRVYTGEFKQNFKHGDGQLKWANGQVFKGKWVEGQKVGKNYLETLSINLQKFFRYLQKTVGTFVNQHGVQRSGSWLPQDLLKEQEPEHYIISVTNMDDRKVTDSNPSKHANEEIIHQLLNSQNQPQFFQANEIQN